MSEYMAPEVMNCRVAGPASDMWSVGVVTYMLLAGGKSPFYSGSRSDKKDLLLAKASKSHLDIGPWREF